MEVYEDKVCCSCGQKIVDDEDTPFELYFIDEDGKLWCNSCYAEQMNFMEQTGRR